MTSACKAVAYYRSRPSEPEASALALRLQREAVQSKVETGDYDLVAEFTEREGEVDSEAYPAFVAAVQAASAHNRGEGFLDVALFIVMQAGIGTGEPFKEPSVERTDGIFTYYFQVPSIPQPPEIALPAGAPGPVSLYASCRPRQLDTLIYLGNAGPDALIDVVVTTDTISMNEFFSSKRGEKPWADGRTSEERWAVVPAGWGVMITSLDHCIWDYVNRYRLAYTDSTGRCCTAEAHDLNLTICDFSEDPDNVWVAFRPIP